MANRPAEEMHMERSEINRIAVVEHFQSTLVGGSRIVWLPGEEGKVMYGSCGPVWTMAFYIVNVGMLSWLESTYRLL